MLVSQTGQWRGERMKGVERWRNLEEERCNCGPKRLKTWISGGLALTPPQTHTHTHTFTLSNCDIQSTCWLGVGRGMGQGSSGYKAGRWCRRFRAPCLRKTGRESATASSSPRTEAGCSPANTNIKDLQKHLIWTQNLIKDPNDPQSKELVWERTEQRT